MATTEDIEKDQYDKIHSLTARMEQLTGAVDVSNQINLELMKLLKKALCYMFWIIVFLIGAIIYGAIGKDGFYAVRQSIPIPENIPTRTPTAALPWHNDFDKGVPIRREDAAAA